MFEVSLHARAHFSTCVRVYAQIFTKLSLVVHYSVLSLSFKFYKNLVFVEEIDICKIERCVFLPLLYVVNFKVHLSLTSHLTSKLELSLAISQL